jgi:hypothetical protein
VAQWDQRQDRRHGNDGAVCRLQNAGVKRTLRARLPEVGSTGLVGPQSRLAPGGIDSDGAGRARPLTAAARGGIAWFAPGGGARIGPDAPSGSRWGCRPMACTRGSPGDALERSQVARPVSIAQRAACLCAPTSAGRRSWGQLVVASAATSMKRDRRKLPVATVGLC